MEYLIVFLFIFGGLYVLGMSAGSDVSTDDRYDMNGE